jgi:virginiamycin B lyase
MIASAREAILRASRVEGWLLHRGRRRAVKIVSEVSVRWSGRPARAGHWPVERAGLLAAGILVALAVRPAPGAAYIYWANRDANTIGCASLDGSGVDQNFIIGAKSPRGVAVDGAHLYWANAPFGGGGTIGRANLDLSDVKQDFIKGSIGPNGVAVDAGHVYFSDFLDAIDRANLDSSGLNQYFISDGVLNPEEVAVGDGHIYFADANGVKRATMDGVVDQMITDAPSTGVAVSGSYVYWTEDGRGAIGRANLDGSDPDPTFITGLSNPQWLAADSSYVYFTDLYGGGETIGRARLDSSGVKQDFITGLDGAEGLAVDARGGQGRCDGGDILVDDPAHGFKVESFGDPATATNIAIIVPGVSNDYGNFGSFRLSAVHVEAEIRRLYPALLSGRSAVIAWLGYTAPDGWSLPAAARPTDAIHGASNLATFIRGLRASSHVPAFELTVIGHSYGSVVVGRAAAAGTLNGANVVFVGSPGVDAVNTTFLGHPRGIFAGENPNDFIQLFSSKPAEEAVLLGTPFSDLATQAIKQQFGLNADFYRIGHGPDPTSPSFGARRFSTNGECGHEYFDDPTDTGTEGLKNLALITMGDGARVSPEKRAPIAPFTVSIGPSATPFLPIRGLKINWTITCDNPLQANAGSGLIERANYDATNDAARAGATPGTALRKLLRRPISEPIIASGPEKITVQLSVSGPGVRPSADPAIAHARAPLAIVMAAGRRSVERASRSTVRLAVTRSGRRFLLKQLARGTHHLAKVRFALSVLVRVRGNVGYFARPIPARL